MTNSTGQGEMPAVLMASGPGHTRGAEISAQSPCACHPVHLPTLPSAELPSVRRDCLSQHPAKVPNIFLPYHHGCQDFEDKVQFTHCSPHYRFMASGTREDDQLNLTESSAAVISPSCLLGLINAKEKESCRKNVINRPAEEHRCCGQGLASWDL